MTFSGWPAEALDFYEHLEADNSKTFWQAHKEQYDDAVRAPMELLLAELEPEFGPGKIFRPNRDVRFSADKSPYKTHIGAHLESGGYVQLSADGLACGNGMYQLAPDQLDRYRAAVAEDVSGAELERVIAAVEQDGPRVHGRSSLRTAPRGFPKDHPRIESAAPQGPGRLAGVGAREVARHPRRPDPDRRLPARLPAAPGLAGRPRRPVRAAGPVRTRRAPVHRTGALRRLTGPTSRTGRSRTPRTGATGR
ncbi:DUF2461 domain-containing protein [Kitasatospora sp. NBC_01300]|uniref:DUF2461 domain-containing protein n=1 Tax=Kitasatospora sp. NBC_01300 TaxID=2903574 RepID=UPI00352C1BA8|nr:DUF2461 domain-containing protein [Kitasatospora sp. NBC_01300]